MADHVGIYAISGAFLPNPATVRLSTVTPTGVLISRTFIEGHVSGGTTTHFPSEETLLNSGTEIITFNAYRPTGSDRWNIVETTYDYDELGAVVGSSTIKQPVYYSKMERLNHSIYKRTPTVADLFNNIPQHSPSASTTIATIVGASAEDVLIGTTNGATAETGEAPSVISVTLYDSSPTITNYVVEACVGNIITLYDATNPEISATFAAHSASSATPGVVTIYTKTSTVSGPGPSGLIFPGGSDVYMLSWAPLSSSVSGVYMNTSYYNPAYIDVEVTSSGKIRDARIWFEMIHDYRVTSSVGWGSPPELGFGLQSFQLALRSPSTNFYSAHPLWNAAGTQQLPVRANPILSGTNNRFGDFYYGVPELLRNSYLLWAGHAVDVGASESLGIDFSSSYHEFDYDIDMRTVFWDGSKINNPRDISSLHLSNGTVLPYSTLITDVNYQQFYQSPTYGATHVTGWQNGYMTDYLTRPVTAPGSLTGTGTPWMFDSRVGIGAFGGAGTPGLGAIDWSSPFGIVAEFNVPPAGWLTSQEAQVAGWQNAQFPAIQPYLFAGGAMIIRPSTTQVYLLGGENIDGAGLMGNHVGAVQFTVDTELQDVSFGAPSILANSTLPVSCSRMGADVYSSLAGQHVILVGGKTGSNDLTGSVKVLVGDFIGADIVWETGSATSSWELPKPVYGMTVHVMDDTAYILGGFTSGAFTTGVLSIPLDPITGRPSGTWVSEGENIITNPVCGATPMHVDGVMYMILEFSDGTPISQIAYVGGQFQGQTRISQDTDPTGPNYFPFKIDGGHIFAIPNADQVGGTLAAEIAFNTGSSAFEILNNAWQNVGTGPGLTTTVAKSGSSAVYGTVIFVGCGISGSTTSAGEPQLHATNIVMQAPAEGEFTTQGKQFGPTTIRPVYPILDDVYSLKSFDAPQTQLAFNRGEIRGYRPGLRDTEVRGTWRFMLGMSEKDFSTLNGSRTDETAGVWFRQARIELVTNTGVPLSDAFPSRTRKWLKSSLVPAPDGFQKIALISGSNQWDVGLNETELYQFPDYGRSVGITAQTSSSPASFAVQTFITGALFTYLSGVGHEASASNPPWFLGGNGFGTPYIPDSSMSLGVTGTALEIDASASQEIYRRTIGQQTIIPNANTMTDYLRRVNYAQTTQQIWEEIQASLLSGTA